MQKAILLLLVVLAVCFFAWSYRAVTPVSRAPNEIVDLQEPINDTEFPFTLPKGTRISVYAKGLKSPRDLETDQMGNVIVSAMGEGIVYLLDGKTNKAVASNLNKPHGLAVNCESSECRLYIAESNQVISYTWDPVQKTASDPKKIISLPTGGRHTTRSLLIHENRLYISIGSSCDTCVEPDKRRATVMSANLDGSDFTTFATGLRNSVFMAINPATNEIWATEMGRDFLGDSIPPEEVNILYKGGFYGWPYCYGKQMLDETFSGDSGICNTSVTPRIYLPAHTAPLGLAFYNGNLLVAMHGSWNSSIPVGYKIVKIDLKTGESEDFISGWLNEGQVLGRPADILVIDDEIYVSDDKAGVVYQIESL